MKTTIEISDALFRQAKSAARRQGTTLRALVEEGLRNTLKAVESRRRFKMRNAAFKGRGLRPEFQEGRWEEIRDAIYAGRGS